MSEPVIPQHERHEPIYANPGCQSCAYLAVRLLAAEAVAARANKALEYMTTHEFKSVAECVNFAKVSIGHKDFVAQPRPITEVQENTQQAATIARIMVVLWDMQRGPNCWCEMATGNPMLSGHTMACKQARALSKQEPK